MKKNRKTILITSALIMLVIWGFIVLEKGTNLFKGLDLFIFILIVVLGVIAFFDAFKKDKFPDVETMLGGGILLSGLIAFISKLIIKKKLNDQ